ncbi:MAG: YciI family protein [Legionellaceae bacterium]|nr:YciI family protein [Legionellaceae bacterium]
MFIVHLTYKVPLSEVDKYLQAHRDFLDYHYKQGLFLASGPRKPRTGGVLIALCDERRELEAVLQQDPYYLADIADYECIEFSPVKHRDEIRELILEREGKLC